MGVCWINHTKCNKIVSANRQFALILRTVSEVVAVNQLKLIFTRNTAILLLLIFKEYHMIGNFYGSNFSWFGKLRQFCGFIFSWHISSNHLVKFSNFSWTSRAHEIHENLNPTEITNHTVFRPHIH